MIHVKHAFRQLFLRPGLSAVVIVMLALGVGATTAMFSLFHQILTEPLPVPEPERLVNLSAPGPKPGATSCTNAGSCEYVLSYPMFRDLEAGQEVFTDIAGHVDFSANLSYDDETVAGSGVLVSGGYFSTLQLRPALGRLIGPQDEPRVGEAPVVVLTYDYWQRYFGGDPDVVDATLTVNGRPLTIVGVASEGFFGTTIGNDPDIFVPLTMRPAMEPHKPRDDLENRRSYWLYAFARLKPGVSPEQAEAGINNLYSGILDDVEVPLNAGIPDGMLERFRERRLTLEPGAKGQSEVPEFAGRPLTLLLGVTVLVLLIVCVNVANLLLARGASRAGEMAVRASIGAGRWRLAMQLLAEAAVLALLGGVLSLPVAAATLKIFLAFSPQDAADLLRVELDSTAMLFTGGVSLSTVLLFGVAPALRAGNADPALAIKRHATQAVGGRGVARFRSTLGTAQIAFSTVLLVMAGLFTQSLVNLSRVELGIDVDSLVTFRVRPGLNGYGAERVRSTYESIEERLAALPGVDDVAASLVPLIANNTWGASLNVEGFEAGAGADTNAMMNAVSPTFFRTLAVDLLGGRGFTEADRRDTPSVAVVNERFVQKFDLGPDPIGKRFGVGGDEPDIEIVGVAADSRYSRVRGEVPPQFFRPRKQIDDPGSASFYVRAGIGADALMRTIRQSVARVDPNLPTEGLTTMSSVVRDNVFLERLVALLSAAFAGLATLLAATGLYGVLAYSVAERTRELGLRLALGASPADIRARVLGQVGRMALVGAAIGVVAAVVLGRAAEAVLFGMRGYDSLVLVSAVAVLLAVLAAAGYLPARRAARVEPMEALRHE